jgi:hypothetical protein
MQPASLPFLSFNPANHRVGFSSGVMGPCKRNLKALSLLQALERKCRRLKAQQPRGHMLELNVALLGGAIAALPLAPQMELRSTG